MYDGVGGRKAITELGPVKRTLVKRKASGCDENCLHDWPVTRSVPIGSCQVRSPRDPGSDWQKINIELAPLRRDLGEP